MHALTLLVVACKFAFNFSKISTNCSKPFFAAMCRAVCPSYIEKTNIKVMFKQIYFSGVCTRKYYHIAHGVS